MRRVEELKRIIELNQQAIFLLRKETYLPEDQIEKCRNVIVASRRELWARGEERQAA